MKRKFLISLVTIGISLSVLASINTKRTIKNLNIQLTKYIQNTDILYSNSILTDDTSSIILNESNSSEENYTEDYYVSINNIHKGFISKTKIENNHYYKYSFTADISVEKGSEKNLITLESSVILDKIDGVYKIVSVYDLSQDIKKELIYLKDSKNEDISSEINNLYMLYSDEDLNISINYPDSYTYSNSRTTDNNTVTNTITFYSSEDKSNNYIQFSLFENVDDSSYSSSITNIENYLNNGFIIKEKKLEDNTFADFTVLSKSFEENGVNQIEELYISSKIKKTTDIDSILINIKMSSEELEKNRLNIDSIIKSLT